MSELKRRTLEAVGGSLALFLAVSWLSGGCAERIAPVDGELSQEHLAEGTPVATVERVEAERWSTASGTLSSARHATISSKILARIETITVRAGDVVEEGDTLARLDARDLRARVKAAQEEIEAARAALTLASSELERIRGLHAKKVASAQQLDQASADHRVARANLANAEERLADARVGLSHAEIRAPVAGRVIDRLAEPGDTAAPGAPLLRIYDPGMLRLEAPVREGIAVSLVPEQPLAVHIESLDLRFEGHIDEIVPAAEPGSRTFLVKVRLPDEPRLYAGMFGRLRLPAGLGMRLSVPPDAIARIGQLEYATVVGSEGDLHRRLVTTAPIPGEPRVEVLSGLVEGERVALLHRSSGTRLNRAAP